ncbi:MAG TPA: M20/M25/M40 family metallo-hydrolase [Planctomycetota bacterium]|nr:M20/M25/M40 family metallo-hydrolase [Planctomycetota bacterium]
MIFRPESASDIGRTVSELVAIKSLSGDEAPMADCIQSHLKGFGLSCARDANDNLLAIIEPRQPGPALDTLHLSGHTDTVVPVEGWSSDPWKPLETGSGDERRLIGLGASDMKSGLAVMLHLARHFSENTNRLARLRLAGSFTVCEEGPAKGKRNGVNDILKLQPGRWALTTEASCDENCPTIALGCQGHAVAKIKLQGRSAHSACPENGLNAIHAAAKICARIEKLNASYKTATVLGDVRARASASVTLIKGGAAGNIIPEHCELTVSRRLAPGDTIANVERELAEATAALDGVTATTSLRCDAPACCVDPHGALFRSATAASIELFGCARYSWNRARTDLVLFKQAGMDVLNIGPGYTGQAHVAGEYVRLADLPRSANLILETIRKLDEWLAAGKR